ncbi:MAG: hypothetical protein KDD67_05850 [Ignavibacteriae bacterium]|nr:hypothetical protein [Ignavibacteriota bacterium]MCB9217507.1 hypothetical protein [Ignavibacteria bacterium]
MNFSRGETASSRFLTGTLSTPVDSKSGVANSREQSIYYSTNSTNAITWHGFLSEIIRSQ